jgi:hypothetical protein
LFSSKLFAQDSIEKQRIAIFAPLYLDSAFDATNNYRYDKTFPRYIIPGLEFYEGVQLALDSMTKENLELEIFVFDTRSTASSIEEQLADAERDSVQMIIAYNSVNEIQPFA